MRLVSLSCSNTEIVCALGCGHMLVGMDADSDHPPEVVADLPKVGRDLDVDADAVAALQPDLVLASLTVPGHEQVVERLEERGLYHQVFEPVRLEDVYDDIERIAELLGVSDRGAHLIAEMRATIPFVPPEPAPDAPCLLVQWWPKPVIAPGEQSWVHDLLLAAGARNPLADRDVKSTPLETWEVLELAPDAIVISWCGVREENYRRDVVLRNEELADTPAVRSGRVVPITEAWLGRPGPRLVEGYRALRDLVQTLAR